MRAAFDADSVDISIAGDKEDVEIELGLREKTRHSETALSAFAGDADGTAEITVEDAAGDTARFGRPLIESLPATRGAQNWPQRPVSLRQRQEIQEMLHDVTGRAHGHC